MKKECLVRLKPDQIQDDLRYLLTYWLLQSRVQIKRADYALVHDPYLLCNPVRDEFFVKHWYVILLKSSVESCLFGNVFMFEISCKICGLHSLI